MTKTGELKSLSTGELAESERLRRLYFAHRLRSNADQILVLQFVSIATALSAVSFTEIAIESIVWLAIGLLSFSVLDRHLRPRVTLDGKLVPRSSTITLVAAREFRQRGFPGATSYLHVPRFVAQGVSSSERHLYQAALFHEIGHLKFNDFFWLCALLGSTLTAMGVATVTALGGTDVSGLQTSFSDSTIEGTDISNIVYFDIAYKSLPLMYLVAGLSITTRTLSHIHDREYRADFLAYCAIGKKYFQYLHYLERKRRINQGRQAFGFFHPPIHKRIYVLKQIFLPNNSFGLLMMISFISFPTILIFIVFLITFVTANSPDIGAMVMIAVPTCLAGAASARLFGTYIADQYRSSRSVKATIWTIAQIAVGLLTSFLIIIMPIILESAKASGITLQFIFSNFFQSLLLFLLYLSVSYLISLVSTLLLVTVFVPFHLLFSHLFDKNHLTA